MQLARVDVTEPCKKSWLMVDTELRVVTRVYGKQEKGCLGRVWSVNRGLHVWVGMAQHGKVTSAYV